MAEVARSTIAIHFVRVRFRAGAAESSSTGKPKLRFHRQTFELSNEH